MVEVVLSRWRRWRMRTLKPFGSFAPPAVRCSLADTNLGLCQALAFAFRERPGVEVVCGNLFDLSCDAVVSPASSFRHMGGGIDMAIDVFLGGEALPRVL